MKVGELIKKLGALDQNLDVLCYTEDEGLLGGKPGFLLLHIESTGTMSGEPTLDESGRVGIKIGQGPKTWAVLNVTADF